MSHIAEKDAPETAPRCICMRPGSSIQCVACYPDFGRRYNDARVTGRTPR